MNILPHKSWHVRTKKNIARVRKDEAEAAEAEKERQRKIALAAQEARTAVLRERAGVRLTSAAETAPLIPGTEVSNSLAPVTDIIQKDGHVNFFQDVEEGKRQGGINDDAEQEKKKEQEDYEKKIGYLVYLGQDSLEASKQKPWYAKIDRSKTETQDDVQKIKQFEKSGYLDHLTKDCNLTAEELKLAKFRSFQDPLKQIRSYMKTPGIALKFKESQPVVTKTTDPIPHSSSPVSSKSKKSKKKSKKSKKDDRHGRKHRSKKHKRKKYDTESSGSEEDSEDERKRKNLETLRAERLEREREEKRRTDRLLAKLRNEKDPEEEMELERQRNSEPAKVVKQKYNAQFNPEFARQNYNFRK